MFDTAAGYCNEWVGHVGGMNAWKEMKVVIFVFKDMVVTLCSNDGCRMFFQAATRAMGGECGKEVLGQVCSGSCGWWVGRLM
jgi:hypothetical protein